VRLIVATGGQRTWPSVIQNELEHLMSGERPAAKATKIKVRKQLITGIGMSTPALIIIHLQGGAIGTVIAAGQPLYLQAGFGLAVGATMALAALIAYRLQASKPHATSVVDSYKRLDLGGWNPVWIGLAAGFGEELLFRAALQPLLGIFFGSLVFVIAHMPAYRVKSFTVTTLIHATGVFAMSILLALVFEFVGLLAAMLVHALIDIVGLYAIRRAAGAVPAVGG
jgi:hypothetical protein